MEVPSSSPIYTPLKPRPRRVIEHVEPVTLFASDADADAPSPRAPERAEREPQAVLAGHEESVIRSSDEEAGDEPSDADDDATHLEDELQWSFAQRPPPDAPPPSTFVSRPHASDAQAPEAVIEDSVAADEPLAFPSSISSFGDDGEETIISDDDDDDGQHTDNDTTAVGIYDASQPKSTQNYLSELLTDSLLESLPLPPDRKQHLREVAMNEAAMK